MNTDRFEGRTRPLAARRFTQRSFALLIVSLVLLGTLATPAVAKPGQTSCQYEYNAATGNFLVYKYKGDTLTYTYATDRPPRNCEPVPLPAVTVTWYDVQGNKCGMTVTVTNFDDGVYQARVNDLFYLDGMILVSGGTGSVSSIDDVTLAGYAFPPGYAALVSVDGVYAELSVAACY
jgi:hypothetical protein